MSRLVLVAFGLLLTGCGSHTADVARNDRDTMTVRQKDSVLGQSVLPGARVVTRALSATDSLIAHNARVTVDTAAADPSAAPR